MRLSVRSPSLSKPHGNYTFSDIIPRLAIWVSKQDHCLYDLLWRIRAKELKAEAVLIISNHQDLAPVAQQFGIEYHYIPITKENKAEQEAKQIEILKKSPYRLSNTR